MRLSSRDAHALQVYCQDAERISGLRATPLEPIIAQPGVPTSSPYHDMRILACEKLALCNRVYRKLKAMKSNHAFTLMAAYCGKKPLEAGLQRLGMLGPVALMTGTAKRSYTRYMKRKRWSDGLQPGLAKWLNPKISNDRVFRETLTEDAESMLSAAVMAWIETE